MDSNDIEKQNKKLFIVLLIIIIFLIIIGFVIGIIMSKNGNYSSNNVSKDNSVIEDNTVADEDEKSDEQIDDNIPDLSNYSIDEKYEKDLLFIDDYVLLNSVADSKNAFLDPIIRMKYVNNYISSIGEYKVTTDTTQQSAYVTKDYYRNTFETLFSNKYDYVETSQAVGRSMWYNECEDYPSAYNGNNICFTLVKGVHGTKTYFVYINEKEENENLFVTGDYHILSDDHKYHKYGTFEIQYDISTSNRIIHSIVITAQK